MYIEQVPENIMSSFKIKIKYDCCGKEHILKWKDADKNYTKNQNKHICRPCWLKLDNPAKKESSKAKAKQTCLEKYGATCALNTKENIDARNEKMFGTQEAADAIVNKRKQTCIKKYGVEHQMYLDETKDKIKKTNMKKYGVEHAMQNDQIKENTRNTIKQRYGVDNVACLDKTQEKMAKTTLERYGVEHYNQLPEMKDYLRENCKEWLAESYANPWAKGITRPEEWNQKQSETVGGLIQSGNWNGGFKSNCRGNYPAKKCKKDKPRFLSSLELQLHFFLDQSDDVEWYDYESLSIPYIQQDESKHLYFPDFLVKYKNDNHLHIIETKTWKEKDSINVKCKQLAAIDYANKNNMTYIILFDEDVDKFSIDIEKVKQIPGVYLK